MYFFIFKYSIEKQNFSFEITLKSNSYFFTQDSKLYLCLFDIAFILYIIIEFLNFFYIRQQIIIALNIMPIPKSKKSI